MAKKQSKKKQQYKKRVESQRRRIEMKAVDKPKTTIKEAKKIEQYNYEKLVKYGVKYYENLTKSYKKYGAKLEKVDVEKFIAQNKIGLESIIFKYKDPMEYAKGKIRTAIKREAGVLTEKQIAAMSSFFDNTEMEFMNLMNAYFQIEEPVAQVLWKKFQVAKKGQSNILKAKLLQEVYAQLKALGLDSVTIESSFIGRYVFGS